MAIPRSVPFLRVRLLRKPVTKYKEYFVVVPTAHFPSCRDLLTAVNSGKEVYLMDTSYQSPKSFTLNTNKRKGNTQLKKNQELLVTNQSHLWLARIRKDSNGRVIARKEGHS